MDANIPYITYQHKYETATVDRKAESELCVNLCVTDTVYKPPSVFLYGTNPPPPKA